MADASCQSDDDDDIIYIGTSARPLIKQEPGTFAENVDINMSTKHIYVTAGASTETQSPLKVPRTIRKRDESNYSDAVAMEGCSPGGKTSTTSEEDPSQFVTENVVSLKTGFQSILMQITPQGPTSVDKRESEPRHANQSLSFPRLSATSQSGTVVVPLPVHEFQDRVSGVEQAKSLRQLSSEGYYRCSGFDCRCMFRTLNPNELEKHLAQDHPSDNTYTCVHCGSAEMGLGNFMHHLEQHLSPQSHSLYCSDTSCNFSAPSPESVISHMGTCHPAHRNHVCWLCNDKFNSLQEFANHVKRNLLIIASCPRCSAKDVHEKEILSHVEFSHPDHSRRVDFHKILLCQDRKMSRWNLQNVTPANGNNIQPSAYIEHISSGSVSHSGIQRQVSIVAARTVGESSSTSAHHPEDNIQPHRQANDASQQQAVSDMQQPVLGDKAGPSVENHSHQSARATTRKRVTFACDVSGDGQPSSDENNADSDDCIHWVRETFREQLHGIVCSRCDTGSQTMEDHMKHIYAFHPEDFMGFACDICHFVSADPEHIHTCRRLRSQPATTSNASTIQADMPGSSNSDMPNQDQVIRGQPKDRKKYRSVGSLTANSLDRNCQQLPLNGTSAPGPSTTSTDTTIIFKDPLLYCTLCDHSGYSLSWMRKHIFEQHEEKMKCPKCDDYVPVNDTGFKVHLSEYHKDVNQALYWQNYSRRWISNEAPDRTMLDQIQQNQHQNNDSMPIRTRKPKTRKKYFQGATYPKWK